MTSAPVEQPVTSDRKSTSCWAYCAARSGVSSRPTASSRTSWETMYPEPVADALSWSLRLTSESMTALQESLATSKRPTATDPGA